MKKVLKILNYYALIPFIASIPGLILSLCGIVCTYISLFVVPLIIAIIYILFRKKIDMPFAMKVNGITLLVLFVCFTVMMIFADGNIESTLMSCFSYLILPFAPVTIIMFIMGELMLLYICAVFSYFLAFAITVFFEKVNIKKFIAPAGIILVCIIISTAFYLNQPSLRYKGHGFDYMNGYSSTDFTDYTVYAQNSKLVKPDSEPSFIIENEDEMPVLDGAEACYPLYAAFAKALYKDIDKIELSELDSNYRYTNGKIVSFTNTISGFNRLVMNRNNLDMYKSSIDMFFGARPSASQMNTAEEYGAMLKITPIGKEAFVFFVEEDNPVDNLSSDEFKAIYHGDITNWRELGGKNQKIVAFQRPRESGSQTMMEYFMDDVPLKEPLTYERIDAMMGVISTVAQYDNEAGAIGYSFRYFLEELGQESGVKMLSIDGVYPTLENIENNSYPLITDVCLITRKNEQNPYVPKMITYILSEDGQNIIRQTGYAGLGKQSPDIN